MDPICMQPHRSAFILEHSWIFLNRQAHGSLICMDSGTFWSWICMHSGTLWTWICMHSVTFRTLICMHSGTFRKIQNYGTFWNILKHPWASLNILLISWMLLSRSGATFGSWTADGMTYLTGEGLAQTEVKEWLEDCVWAKLVDMIVCNTSSRFSVMEAGSSVSSWVSNISHFLTM